MNRGLARVLDAAIRALLVPLGARRRQMVLAQLAPRLVPEVTVTTRRGALRLACEGRQALYWSRFFFSHEPDTLAWIDGFGAGDVLWDVGANTGIYSLYAALVPGVRILAFEPGAANYHALTRNILLNRMQDRVSAYCLAFADRVEIGALNLSANAAGADTNVYGEGTDSWGQRPAGDARQAALAFTIDEFAARLAPPFPTHLKIDVDGAEDRILKGGGAVLADARLRSILVEFPDQVSERSREMRRLIEAGGFALATASTNQPKWQNLIFQRR